MTRCWRSLVSVRDMGLLKDVWIVGNSEYPLMDWVLVPYKFERESDRWVHPCRILAHTLFVKFQAQEKEQVSFFFLLIYLNFLWIINIYKQRKAKNTNSYKLHPSLQKQNKRDSSQNQKNQKNYKTLTISLKNELSYWLF